MHPDFSGKTLLITGGTGSFGNGAVARLLETGIGEIRIFSRDEKKQDDMRNLCRIRHPASWGKLRFYLGDVREPGSLRAPMEGADYVIHAAALKQVPSCEFFPLEAVRTNVLGTEHVLEAAAAAGVKALVCLSTDKAAYPINAMGASKALMEKAALAKAASLGPSRTRITCTRCGNVMGTRGSVIPLFLQQISSGGPLTLTEPAMTRFLMTMDEAIDLVLLALTQGQPGDIWVRKAPACTLGDLAQALLELLGRSVSSVILGARHGEKLAETLLTAEEAAVALDCGACFRSPQDRRDQPDGLTPAVPTALGEPFSSDRALRLDVSQIREKLLQLPEIRALLTREGRL